MGERLVMRLLMFSFEFVMTWAMRQLPLLGEAKYDMSDTDIKKCIP